MLDYYKLLSLPRAASQKQIKEAYRIYAQHLHPDKHHDAAQPSPPPPASGAAGAPGATGAPGAAGAAAQPAPSFGYEGEVGRRVAKEAARIAAELSTVKAKSHKFRDITAAYRVLSNNKERSKYDKGWERRVGLGDITSYRSPQFTGEAASEAADAHIQQKTWTSAAGTVGGGAGVGMGAVAEGSGSSGGSGSSSGSGTQSDALATYARRKAMKAEAKAGGHSGTHRAKDSIIERSRRRRMDREQQQKEAGAAADLSGLGVGARMALAQGAGAAGGGSSSDRGTPASSSSCVVS